MSTPELKLTETDPLEYILPELRQFAVPIDELLQDPENTASHDSRNLKVVAESIKRFKQRRLAIFNEEKVEGEMRKVIKVGNGMQVAMKLLGYKFIAAVGVNDKRSEAMAYAMVDNRSSSLTGTKYDQQAKNMQELKEDKHPMLEIMFTEEEQVPLMRAGEFQLSAITDEKFDATMLRGRAVNKITAAERITVDRAIKFTRYRDGKGLTEGACLEKICGEYIANHLEEFEASGVETEPPDAQEVEEEEPGADKDWSGDHDLNPDLFDEEKTAEGDGAEKTGIEAPADGQEVELTEEPSEPRKAEAQGLPFGEDETADF